MLSNIESITDLRGLARLKIRDYVTKTVKHDVVEEALNQGWNIEQKNEKTTRLRKKKDYHCHYVDRIWALLYRMDFIYLNGEGSALLINDSKEVNSAPLIFDIIGIDDEVGIAIKCVTAERKAVFGQFRDEVDQYILTRQNFAQAVNQQIPRPFDRQAKRSVGLAIFTLNMLTSDEDKKYAKDKGIMLFDENDLSYYEELTGHLGSAAKYQFLADMFANKNIQGLNIKVPAIRTRIGDYTCYTFPIRPEYLLKIAYVSHHSKGKNSDMGTYQRMLQKTRLRKIRRYIDQNGIFPTNIVISFERKPIFHRGEQEAEQDGGTVGWLEVKSSYKSAWVIDGQHRLFAYSGQPQSSKAYLSVLAFESLPSSTQARLFIDINAEQKSVKQSLLQELYADLHKDATDPTKRVRAIIAQIIQWLDGDPDSAFYERIQASEDKKDDIRCISWNSLFRVLDSDLFISATKKGDSLFGPLWCDEDNGITRERAVQILKKWFGRVRDSVPDWWNIGAGEGGGIAMNDSVVANINVLRSVFQHLSTTLEDLRLLSNQELSEAIEPYADAVGNYMRSLSEDGRKSYRSLRGSQGQSTRARRMQQAIQKLIPSFAPTGLKAFIEEQQAQTNIRAKIIIDDIEKTLQANIMDVLKGEFVETEQWWFDGIPKQIRTKVMQRYEDDNGQRGKKEYYLDLIDYRTIIQQHWSLFNKLFGYGKANLSKEKRTAWLNDVNDLRKIVAHGSSGRSVTVEQLALLEEYSEWLKTQVDKLDDDKDEGQGLEDEG